MGKKKTIGIVAAVLILAVIGLFVFGMGKKYSNNDPQKEDQLNTGTQSEQDSVSEEDTEEDRKEEDQKEDNNTSEEKTDKEELPEHIDLWDEEAENPDESDSDSQDQNQNTGTENSNTEEDEVDTKQEIELPDDVWAD